YNKEIIFTEVSFLPQEADLLQVPNPKTIHATPAILATFHPREADPKGKKEDDTHDMETCPQRIIVLRQRTTRIKFKDSNEEQ
ncbi:7944_t:CDS:2, partial [Gigaspora margarita]